jgi:hypothetical protein
MTLIEKIDHVEKQILDNDYATVDYLEKIRNHCDKHAPFSDDDYYSLILEIFNKAENKKFFGVLEKKVKDLTEDDFEEVFIDEEDFYFDLMDLSISKKQAANMKLRTVLQKVYGA